MMTITQRYNAILLAFFRHLTRENQVRPSEAVNDIVYYLGHPDIAPTASESLWLNALKARIDAELGDAMPPAASESDDVPVPPAPRVKGAP